MSKGNNSYDLENQFHRAMIGIYDAALKKCNYRATYFLQMVNEQEGMQAAKRLLNKTGLQYGFTELWLCGCLKLTMEALVLQPQFSVLFTEEEKQVAKNRLQECGFNKEDNS